jgi:xylulokinase
MPNNVLMGIDIGTYSSKGVLCEQDGSIMAEARVAHGISVPGPGLMEHDADDIWWHDLRILSRRLLAFTQPRTRVTAVGVSALGPCLLPVGIDGRPLRKAILYGADTRATQQVARLKARYGGALARLGGVPVTTQAVGPKILWLSDNEPEIFSRAAKILSATGYLVYKLTGEYVVDRHNASFFAPFYDIHRGEWDLRFADGRVPPDLLPHLSWTSDVVGMVSARAAAETGLAEGTPVIAGTTDGAAEAVGAGAIEAGDLVIGYGSTAMLLLVLDRFRSGGSLWVTHGSSPGEYQVAGSTSTGGSITAWYREQFAREMPQSSYQDVGEAHALLSSEAEASPAGSNGLLLLPYFSGERSPFNDPDARGVIAGLTLSHGRGDIYRAILEGVAFAIRHNLAEMSEIGTGIRRVFAVGGGTASRLWLQIVSDVTGLTQHLPERAGGAAYGDAYLAGRATGLVSTGWARTGDQIVPDHQRRSLYDERYESYLELYRRTRKIVHALAATSRRDAR